MGGVTVVGGGLIALPAPTGLPPEGGFPAVVGVGLGSAVCVPCSSGALCVSAVWARGGVIARATARTSRRPSHRFPAGGPRAPPGGAARPWCVDRRRI